MVNGWGASPLTKPQRARTTFSVVANKGGPTNPYTVGIGSSPAPDLALAPPQTLIGAGLELLSSSPIVELPRALLTDDAYEAIQIKGLTNPLFTNVYYNLTYTTKGYASLFLWPVPDGSQSTNLVLYYQPSVAEFADLATQYYFPPSYADAFAYNLAVRLADPMFRTCPPGVAQRAVQALAALKRANANNLLNDMPQDPAVTPTQKTTYNIQTGSSPSN